MTVAESFLLHRQRLWSPSDLAKKIEEAKALAASTVPSTIAAGIQLAEEALVRAPYEPALHLLLANHHAREGNRLLWSEHLAQAFDMNAAILADEQLQASWSRDLPDTEVPEELRQIQRSQSDRARGSKHLRFDEIAPNRETLSVELRWGESADEAMEAIYLNLLQHCDAMEALVFSQAEDDDNVVLRGDRLQSPFNLDEYFVGAFSLRGYIHQALQAFAPYLEDVRFSMCAQTGPLDEYWVVNGTLYVYRHEPSEHDHFDQQRGLRELARHVPLDKELRAYLAMKIGDVVAEYVIAWETHTDRVAAG
ncbi:MAG: hypothetical protein AAFQ82_14605, partial [Myxococcota bacterium]